MGGLVSKAVFPIPKSSYDEDDFTGVDRLFRIKTPNAKKTKQLFELPMLYLPYLDDDDNTSPYLLIYFHANAEDIGIAYDSLLFDIRNNLQISVLAPEYAGYGLYVDSKPNARQLECDSERIYQYAVTDLQYPQDKIILIARSLGGGPLCYLASRFKPRAVILFMCFASLRRVAENVTTKMLAKVVPDEFRNIDLVEYINCPVLIIHGEKDKLVPFNHAEQMWKIVQQIAPRQGIIHHCHFSKDMDHNKFILDKDLIEPIEEFFRLNDIKTMDDEQKIEFIKMPLFKYLYKDLYLEQQEQEIIYNEQQLDKESENKPKSEVKYKNQSLEVSYSNNSNSQNSQEKIKSGIEIKRVISFNNTVNTNNQQQKQVQDKNKQQQQNIIIKEQDSQQQNDQNQQNKQDDQQQKEVVNKRAHRKSIHENTTQKSFHANIEDVDQILKYEELLKNNKDLNNIENYQDLTQEKLDNQEELIENFNMNSLEQQDDGNKNSEDE